MNDPMEIEMGWLVFALLLGFFIVECGKHGIVKMTVFVLVASLIFSTAIDLFNNSAHNPIACTVGDRNRVAITSNCNPNLPDPVRQN